jgi:hypothetical protein
MDMDGYPNYPYPNRINHISKPLYKCTILTYYETNIFIDVNYFKIR